MKKTIVLTIAFLASTTFAGSNGFLINNDPDMTYQGYGKVHKCMVTGFDAANLNPEQKTTLEGLKKSAHEFYNLHKMELQLAKADMKTAWEKHPIMKEEIVAAKTKFKTAMEPISDNLMDTAINSINLLDATQRGLFNTALKTCIKRK